jgi:hypothetical protein
MASFLQTRRKNANNEPEKEDFDPYRRRWFWAPQRRPGHSGSMEQMHGAECELNLVNPLEDRRTPFFLRDSQSDYDLIVKQAPELYRMGYDASDKPIPSAIAESALKILLYESCMIW